MMELGDSVRRDQGVSELVATYVAPDGHRDTLKFKKDFPAITFLSNYIIPVRRSKKNEKYYYYHETYGDPIQYYYLGSKLGAKIQDFIHYYRSKIYSKLGLKNYVVKHRYNLDHPFIIIDFLNKKVYSAEAVKAIKYHLNWQPAGVKFYLLKIVDEADLELQNSQEIG